MAAGDVRIRISGTDETAGAFRSAQQKLDQVAGSATKASRALNSILTGGGILIAFRTLERHLADVAERFSDVNAGAAEFVQTGKLLSSATDQGFLAILQALAPAIKAIGDVMDPTTLAYARLTTATNDLKAAEQALADARNTPRSSFNYAADPEKVRAAEKELREKQAGLDAARLSLNRGLAFERAGAAIDLYQQGEAPANRRAQGEQSKAKAAADKLLRIQLENSKRLSDLTWDQIEDDRKAAEDKLDWEKKIGQAEIDRIEASIDLQTKQFEKAKEQAQAFGDLFVDVVLQAGDSSFKDLLEGWGQTLLLMIAKAQAMKVFESIVGKKGFTSSAGGWVGAVAGALGFAEGGSFKVGGSGGTDSQYVPLALTPGEQVSITPPGKSSGNVVNINQNVSVGAGASRAEVMAAMTVAKNAAKAEIRNEMRRGR